MTKTRLPIVGSTAPTTTFCTARVEGPDGTFLYVDGNQKITRDNGSYAAPTPNAFSLLHIEDCPGSTPTCRKSCYVHGLASAVPATYELYRHNSVAIREILENPMLAGEWVLIMAAWISENADGGFRWHVSGDVFSESYARWIVDVCRESSTVDHWLYTRSFEFVDVLAQVATVHDGNLALNLSCDKDNYGEAMVTSTTFGAHRNPLRLCYLVEAENPNVPADLPGNSVLFPDYDLRPKGVEDPLHHPFWASLTPDQRKMMCPVDSHSKSEKIRCGPCARCL